MDWLLAVSQNSSDGMATSRLAPGILLKAERSSRQVQADQCERTGAVSPGQTSVVQINSQSVEYARTGTLRRPSACGTSRRQITAACGSTGPTRHLLQPITDSVVCIYGRLA